MKEPSRFPLFFRFSLFFPLFPDFLPESLSRFLAFCLLSGGHNAPPPHQYVATPLVIWDLRSQSEESECVNYKQGYQVSFKIPFILSDLL